MPVLDNEVTGHDHLSTKHGMAIWGKIERFETSGVRVSWFCVSLPYRLQDGGPAVIQRLLRLLEHYTHAIGQLWSDRM